MGNVQRNSAHAEAALDAVFAALADPTRRRILRRLSRGEACVTEIAEPFAVSQPAISKHLKVLEKAGLIERAVDAQRRPARLRAAPMRAAVQWLEAFETFWADSLDGLDAVLNDLKNAADAAGTEEGGDP